MSRFYARYVPPTKKLEAVDSPVSRPEKRKREDEPSIEQTSKISKTLRKAAQDANETAQRSSSTADLLPSGHISSTGGKNVLDKYRVTEAARTGSPSVTIKARRPKTSQSQEERDQELKTPSVKKRKTDYQENGESEETVYDKKHSGLLSKFEKAKWKDADAVQKPDVVLEKQPVVLHGLEPIPQPEQEDVPLERRTYSTLPAWQEKPLNVPLEGNATFASLGVSDTLLGNLEKRGLKHAFPVQAAVLPLLLDGPGKHDGDLCVSAATGSGKTLSYVLPVIAGLKDLAGIKLRAVIVVPTRELVKQVLELCEMCAAGTSLKFTTAVGSKSLKEEQEMLVVEEKIYDPEQYKKWQDSPIDWSAFSLERLVRKARNEDPLASLGYVTRYRSKADVLITTPGRLVDHLKSTIGFTLDNVKWLVVDEADRLLNESYQEWIEVVKPALESQAATQERDDLLRFMRMTPPRRKVTKILLSATMTRDISKLNTLGLNNPQLIVLGGVPKLESKGSRVDPVADKLEEQPQEEAGVFHLPETLHETAIPLPDGSEKPLYLLKLLQNHINISAESLETNNDGLGQDSDSESESSSDSSSDSEDVTPSEAESSSSSDGSLDSAQISSTQNTLLEEPKSIPRASENPRALIFTRSTTSATRLSRLLILLRPQLAPRIATLTRSTTSSASSRRALSSFRNSKISILIATDRASRGLDVPDLENIVSYDVPSSALTYVHRVGRTARAGKIGQAWTFVEHREGAWFWREIGGKGKSSAAGPGVDEFSINRKTRIKRLHLSVEQDNLKQRYEEALRQLGEEARGK